MGILPSLTIPARIRKYGKSLYSDCWRKERKSSWGGVSFAVVRLPSEETHSKFFASSRAQLVMCSDHARPRKTNGKTNPSPKLFEKKDL